MRHRLMVSLLAIGLIVALGSFLATSRFAQDPSSLNEQATASPAPRWPDGQVRLGRAPGEKGYWGRASVTGLVETGVSVQMNENGLLLDIADAGKVAPFQPWALALYEYRQRNGLNHDPVLNCLPPGGLRHFHTPGGFRIIEDRASTRIFVAFGGGNRNWRLIHLDGRLQPNIEEVTSTYFGHSVGHWEGDTVVVESVGFSDRFWFSNGGLPHTEALHLTERISRPNFSTLRYEVTVDDPRTYTRPWSSAWTIERVPDGYIEEQFCEDRVRFQNPV